MLQRAEYALAEARSRSSSSTGVSRSGWAVAATYPSYSSLTFGPSVYSPGPAGDTSARPCSRMELIR